MTPTTYAIHAEAHGANITYRLESPLYTDEKITSEADIVICPEVMELIPLAIAEIAIAFALPAEVITINRLIRLDTAAELAALRRDMMFI